MMKKLFFLLVLVCLIAASTVLIFLPTPTEACGYREPVTLLQLYKMSDAIYIARYSGSEIGAQISDNDDYKQDELKKYFDVTYTLKGNPVKEFTQFDVHYVHKEENKGFETLEEVEAANVVPDIHLDDDEESNELKPGDTVLLFARMDQDAGRMELADFVDGIKKLPLEDLRVYEGRIKELNTIFAAEEPDLEKITDWLVRCAEDRATRWEGAYELRRSFAALDNRQRREAKRNAERLTAKSNSDDEDSDDDEDDDEGQQDEIVILYSGLTPYYYAELLNPYHKQALANILLNSEFQTDPQPSDRAVLVHGDRELISLLARWADPRLTELFMSRLRGGSYSPRQNAELMETIASILDDQEAHDIATKFSEIAYKGDEDAVESDDLEADEKESDDEAEPVETASEGSDNVVEAEDEFAADDEASEEAESQETETEPVFTYKQFRQELIDNFLRRAENVVDDPAQRTPRKK